jgi:hypothetical protein
MSFEKLCWIGPPILFQSFRGSECKWNARFLASQKAHLRIPPSINWNKKEAEAFVANGKETRRVLIGKQSCIHVWLFYLAEKNSICLFVMPHLPRLIIAIRVMIDSGMFDNKKRFFLNIRFTTTKICWRRYLHPLPVNLSWRVGLK